MSNYRKPDWRTTLCLACALTAFLMLTYVIFDNSDAYDSLDDLGKSEVSDVVVEVFHLDFFGWFLCFVVIEVSVILIVGFGDADGRSKKK